MSERVLFVANPYLSRGLCEIVPAIRGALDDLRAHFEVEVFRYFAREDGQHPPGDWRATVDALVGQLTPGCHVVAMGASGSPILVALARHGDAGCYVAAGCNFSGTTLRALDRSSLADIADSSLLDMRRPYDYVRLVTQGASDEVTRDLSAQVVAEVDWGLTQAHFRSWNSLNMVREVGILGNPTLYLEPALKVPTFADMQEVFMQFVPRAEIGHLPTWPTRLHEAETGHELSSAAISFIRKHSPAEVAS